MGAAKPFMAASREFAEVYGVKPLQVSQWIGRGVLDYTHAVVVSGSPYWPLGFVRGFGQTTARPKEVRQEVLDRLVGEQSPGRWTSERGGIPPLAGAQEAQRLFGLGNVAQLSVLSVAGGVAQADYYLSGSPLWLLDSLLAKAPALRAQARTLPWVVDEGVAEALREGRYDGPGSVVKPRGRAASRV